MKFTVDFRAADGSRQQKEIVAADRAGVFTELKKLGISAITVREGAMVKAPAPASPSLVKGLVAGLVVVVALAGVLYLVVGGRAENSADEERGVSRIKDVGPSVVSGKGGQDVLSSDSLKEGLKPSGEEGAVGTSNKVDYSAMSADEAAKHGYYKAAERLKGVHPRIFKTTSEEIVAGIMCTKPGTPVVLVPLPAKFDEEIKQALVEPPVKIEDGDDEYARSRKQAMLNARQIFIDAIANGESPSVLVEDARKELRKIAEVRQNVAMGLAELRKKGAGRDEIYDYIEAGNKLLEKYEAMPLLAPLGLKKRIELEKLSLGETAE